MTIYRFVLIVNGATGTTTHFNRHRCLRYEIESFMSILLSQAQIMGWTRSHSLVKWQKKFFWGGQFPRQLDQMRLPLPHLILIFGGFLLSRAVILDTLRNGRHRPNPRVRVGMTRITSYRFCWDPLPVRVAITGPNRFVAFFVWPIAMRLNQKQWFYHPSCWSYWRLLFLVWDYNWTFFCYQVAYPVGCLLPGNRRGLYLI